MLLVSYFGRADIGIKHMDDVCMESFENCSDKKVNVIDHSNEILTAQERFRAQCKNGSVLEIPDDREVFVIPDIHGDGAALKEVMLNMKLVDMENLDWIGGNKVLVQIGDIFDRGPDTAEIYQLFFKWRDQAELSNGCVVMLLGNHEVLNLMHDFRYASEKETENFGGLAARKIALAPASEIGRELRLQRMGLIVQQGNQRSFFVHAGILPMTIKTISKVENSNKNANGYVEGLNKFSREALKSGSQGASLHMELSSQALTNGLFGNSGPLWSRFFPTTTEVANEGDGCAMLDKLLQLLLIDRMIIGHTVQESLKVAQRCGGRLILADVGLNSYYGGGREIVKLSNSGLRIIK